MVVVLGGNMPNPISERLASLAQLNKTELRDLWRQLLQAVPPPQIRRDLMVPILAYLIQEQAFGSLRPNSCMRLRQLAQAFETNPNARISSTPGIKPGTRIVRQWKEQVHVVNVEEMGYEYKGARYESLSEIARLITGTRWSGPLFFGLKQKPSDPQEAK
jgi:hypothetical protein